VVLTACSAIYLGMGWAPLTQNLIRYESKSITIEEGTALLSRSVEPCWCNHDEKKPTANRGNNLLAHHKDPFLELDIWSALLTAPNNDVNIPMFFCSTGNCTWGPIATLGFCSQCADITSQIDLACKTSELVSKRESRISQTCKAVLRGGTAGLSLIGTDTTFETLMHVTQVGGNEGLRYHSIRMLPPYNMTSAVRRPVTLANFGATECTLSPCVLSLQASVRNGIYSEMILDTFTEPPPSDSTWIKHKLQPPWDLERGIDPKANLSFGLSSELQDDWQGSGFLLRNTTIPGWARTRDGHTGIDFGVDNKNSNGPVPGYIFNANYPPSACNSPNGDTFACAMRSIAAALTKTVRNAGVVTNGTGLGDEFLVRGRAQSSATFVRVEWHWIALPCAVWILGLFAWVSVAVQTHRMSLPTWRDNFLPLFFLYRGGDSHQQSGRAVQTSLQNETLAADRCSSWAYEEIAEGINVQLREVPQPGGGGVMRLMPTVKG
ncbi:hypothetical protein QBC35DRAFT_395373, partial [Podospora australis]